MRPLDGLEATSLFTGAPRAPFVSPDGQWVGFTDGATLLKKVPIGGGPAVSIAPTDGGTRGAAWTPDDMIVFATNAGATGLQQVPAAGGPMTVLTRPDRTRGEAEHVWPEVLPGGRAVLFTILPVKLNLEGAQIAVFDRETGRQAVVVRGGDLPARQSRGWPDRSSIGRRGGRPLALGPRPQDLDPSDVHAGKATTTPDALPPQLLVVPRFDEELRRLAPTN